MYTSMGEKYFAKKISAPKEGRFVAKRVLRCRRAGFAPLPSKRLKSRFLPTGYAALLGEDESNSLPGVGSLAENRPSQEQGRNGTDR